MLLELYPELCLEFMCFIYLFVGIIIITIECVAAFLIEVLDEDDKTVKQKKKKGE